MPYWSSHSNWELAPSSQTPKPVRWLLLRTGPPKVPGSAPSLMELLVQWGFGHWCAVQPRWGWGRSEARGCWGRGGASQPREEWGLGG